LAWPLAPPAAPLLSEDVGLPSVDESQSCKERLIARQLQRRQTLPAGARSGLDRVVTLLTTAFLPQVRNKDASPKQA
jgi:hypothetical protein